MVAGERGQGSAGGLPRSAFSGQSLKIPARGQPRVPAAQPRQSHFPAWSAMAAL
jgi:hypothetical protein